MDKADLDRLIIAIMASGIAAASQRTIGAKKAGELYRAVEASLMAAGVTGQHRATSETD